MQMPKKVKYRKMQKGRRRTKGYAARRTGLSFGDFGLKSLGTHWISSRQIEAGRRAITHCLKKGGKLWIRVFADKSVTFKGSEIPMGGGKGAVDHYVSPVKAGTIIFEIAGVGENIAREALRLASHKLPVKTKFVKR